MLAHVPGELVVHDDTGWLADHVRRLTGVHQEGRSQQWAVTDAPAPFVAGQLRAIVGVEVGIDRVEATWKLSQNRPGADVDGEDATAAAVQAARG